MRDPGVKRYRQGGGGTFLICGTIGGVMTLVALWQMTLPLLIAPVVCVIVAFAFSSVTIEPGPGDVAIAIGNGFFKRRIGYRSIQNLRVINYRAPSLGYRVGFGMRIYAVSWGPALIFDADGLRYIVGCDDAQNALADIQTRVASGA